MSVAVKNFLISRFLDESAFDNLCRESGIQYDSSENFEARITGFLKKASGSFPDYILRIYNACMTLRPRYRGEIDRLFEVPSSQTKGSPIYTGSQGTPDAKYTLRILHISDLHFRATDEDPVRSFNADLVSSSMVHKIEELPSFDMVIITGDLVFSGKPEEYKVAKAFCSKIRTVTGIPHTMLFVVPGNHDLDRSAIKSWHKRGLSFGNQDEITEIYTEAELFTGIMKKFDAFFDFANNLAGTTLFDTNRFYYIQQVPFRKHRQECTLNLLGLNSVVFGGYDENDEKNLALGLYQVRKALEKKDKDALFSIGFFHHPFSCLHPEETISINMLKQGTDLLLHGHLHNPLNSITRDGAGRAVTIGAGAGYETRESANSFNVIEIDCNTGAGWVRFYKYLPGHNTWIENIEVNPHDPDHAFHFSLPVKKTDKNNPET